MYFRDADGVIMVFDITDRQSFENLKNEWMPEIESKAPSNIQIAIVGNKSDLTEKEAVSLKEA